MGGVCAAKMGGVAQARASSVWSMKRFFFITGGGQVLRLATSAEPDVGRFRSVCHDRFEEVIRFEGDEGSYHKSL